MFFNIYFAKYLIEKSIFDKDLLDNQLKTANRLNIPLYRILVENRIAKEEIIYKYLADYLKYDYRFCQFSDIDMDFVKKYPRDMMVEHQAIPLRLHYKSLQLLCSDPINIEEFNRFLYYGGKNIELIICPPSQFKKLLEYVNNVMIHNTAISQDTFKESIQGSVNDDSKEASPIISLCDSILIDAINIGASDIHIEPFAKKVLLRCRIDGRLKKIDEIPVSIFPELVARYKIMSKMNIAERRVPQDGKISLEINNKKYDFRVSTIPTIYGEKIVIRIYNSAFTTADISSLGFSDKQMPLVLSMINRPHGIILLTGPTGSGKSTTLYTFLRYLANEETNIVTVEDPIENEIEGINQVQVNPKANLTFSVALRSFLRQDPNIIMVGEIRDEETAQIATRAAITGHLVLSSIHTNDAVGVISRLINMGIPRYLVADALVGAISQQLVRKLCPKCKQSRITSQSEMELLSITKSINIFIPNGCSYCNNTGYSGRTGVFEIMLLTEDIRNIIMSNEFNSERVTKIVERDMTTLASHAREKVLLGETSIEEYIKLIDIQ